MLRMYGKNHNFPYVDYEFDDPSLDASEGDFTFILTHDLEADDWYSVIHTAPNKNADYNDPVMMPKEITYMLRAIAENV